MRNTMVVYLHEESLVLLLDSPLHATTNQKENVLQYLTKKNHSQYGKMHATQKNASHKSILQGSA